MKKILTFLIFASTVGAFAQDFTASTNGGRIRNRPVRIVTEPAFEGSIPRIIRSGNPAQMLNPAAPREYGSGAPLVARDQGDPFVRTPNGDARPVGIRLFSFAF